MLLPQLKKSNYLLRLLNRTRTVSNGNPHIRTIAQNRLKQTKSNEEENIDKPIPYTTSPAFKWKAEYSRMGTSSQRLWYEPVVTLASIAVFLIYFCILREESDIDKEFDKTLFSRIEGLEKQQILLALRYNREHGIDTVALERRLREIEEIEQQPKEQ